MTFDGTRTPFSSHRCPSPRASDRCARLAHPSAPRQPHALKIEAQLTSSDPSPSIARRSQKLQRAGFVSVRDVKKTHGPVELALGTRVAPRTPRAPSTPMWAPPPPRVPSFPRFSPAAPPRSTPRAEAGLTNEEASEVMKVVRFGVSGTALAGAKSASELLKEESVKIPIYTFCLELDDLLGGGVATGEITELCGCPGIGKTQTGIQLCCSVQIPAPFGGHDGQAVYVDTEGSFMAERAADVAAATVEHLGAIARASPEDPGMADAMASFTVERVLERIHLFRCHEVTELLAVLETLPAYCARRGVKLVVIDSVAFHFRQDFRDMALRTTILAKMTNRLMDLATRQDLAVVTVNQVTVKPDPSGVGGARLVPALGESYAHACTTRVILSWEDDVRTAYLYKSPRLAQGRARYTVTEGGVRDVRGTKRSAE